MIKMCKTNNWNVKGSDDFQTSPTLDHPINYLLCSCINWHSYYSGGNNILYQSHIEVQLLRQTNEIEIEKNGTKMSSENIFYKISNNICTYKVCFALILVYVIKCFTFLKSLCCMHFCNVMSCPCVSPNNCDQFPFKNWFYTFYYFFYTFVHTFNIIFSKIWEYNNIKCYCSQYMYIHAQPALNAIRYVYLYITSRMCTNFKKIHKKRRRNHRGKEDKIYYFCNMWIE